MLYVDCICDGFYSRSLLQGEHYLGKREPEFAGRHTEGSWSPGRQKRSTQLGLMIKGGIPWTYNIKNLLAPSTRWTPGPTSALHFTSLMDPSINMKRTELGPWGRLNKRNAELSPSSSETHPLIGIIRDFRFKFFVRLTYRVFQIGILVYTV